MVLADRNSDSGRDAQESGGPITRQNRSPSESSPKEAGIRIRVGGDYQAIIPELIPADQRMPEQDAERAVLLWSPTTDIPDYKLDEYISLAKGKYKYSAEQALGLLFHHKYDMEKAVLDLDNFALRPSEYTVKE